MKTKSYILALAICLSLAGSVLANDWATTGKGGSSGKLSAEQVTAAWDGLAKYKSGDDQHAFLTLEWVVINSIGDAKAQGTTAAKLASYLAKPDLSFDSKCFICAMLFRCGTPAEVPAVAKLLDDPKTADIARLFLERVPGDEATQALRAALTKLKGKRESIGVMNSLSIRKDEASLPAFFEMTSAKDKEIALAAWRAISNIPCDRSADFLAGKLKSCQVVNIPLEAATIRVAAWIKNQAKAAELYSLLATGTRGQGARQAVALDKYNRANDAEKATLTAQWMKSSDIALLKLAAGQIMKLDDATVEKLMQQKDVAAKLRLILTEELARRQGEKMIPIMLKNAKSSDPATVRMALQFLGQCPGDSRVLPALIDALAGPDDIAQVAMESMAKLPKSDVGQALVTALKTQSSPAVRERIVTLLSTLKYYEAIKPLTVLASNPDPAVYEAAIDGLRGVCDPDQPDLSNMFNLYMAVKNSKQIDYVARAIAYIAEKNPDKAKRANIILACVAAKKNTSDDFVCKVLPMLGRLGGDKVYAQVEAGMKSSNPKVAFAAFTALCNWPNAEHADALWNVVQVNDQVLANRALRAYIRVITLPNKRPEAETLAMLKKAMAAAKNNTNRNLALARASAVRTMDAVNWVASFLDNPAMSETACKAIVSLAHHRFLRQPNKSLFEPILLKVEKTAKDKKTAELAAKARMGM